MTGRQAVFTGVARDCAHWLPGVLDNIDRFAAHYTRTAFVFAVSDSNDASVPMLRSWLARGRPGTVLDLGALAGRLPRRTERIAHARNACLDEITRSGWTAYDHLVIADLDDVLAGPVPAEAYARASRWLEKMPSRSAVFASATPRYYDIWALRHAAWCPDDCWHAIWERPATVSFEAAKFREVFSRQILLPSDLPPVEVRSAFGGLGLYRMSRVRDARYCGIDRRGREVSEHVAFNEAVAAAGGTLHVFPELRVQAPRQHLYSPSDFGWRWRLAMNASRAFEQYRAPWRRLLAPR